MRRPLPSRRGTASNGRNRMLLVDATLVIAAIVVLLVLYLGLKYPRGWKEWPHDIATTWRYLLSGALFLVIIGLIYWVTRYWDYPVGGRGLTYVAFATFAILFVLGIIFPRGRSI